MKEEEFESDTAVSQGMPRIASNPQKLGEQHATHSSLEPSEGVWLGQHIDFRLLTSRTLSE